MAKKNSYGEWMKRKAQFEDDRYFGKDNKQKTSNQYFSFRHYLSDDEVIINTSDIRFVKGSPVLLVGDSEAVYLKNWQMKEVEAYGVGGFWLVKLNRNFFKTYHFHAPFDGVDFDKVETFDDMVALSKAQDEKGLEVRKSKGALFN